jgi:large subunit ribosomal protein L21
MSPLFARGVIPAGLSFFAFTLRLNMYAVIKTGGKQYRVQPGDTIVVEKLEGDAGAELKFDNVLMLGGDNGVTVGAPLIDGAAVSATLIETRKGEKVKVFKKIRRQGYRRTNGHRQWESVLRVTGIDGAGETAKWDGAVRNLASRTATSELASSDLGSVETVVTDVDGPVVEATVVESSAPAKKPRKAAAPKADAAGDEA